MGNVRIVKVLLAYGANPKLQNENGDTPLHVAVKGQTPFRWNAETVSVGHRSQHALIVSILINFKISSIDIRNKKGMTALDIAALCEDETMLDIFAKNLIQPTFESADTYSTVNLNLSFTLPLTLTNLGLCKTIYESLSLFYHELDGLERSGFAIGFDYLPNDLPLASPENLVMFSGTYF